MTEEQKLAPMEIALAALNTQPVNLPQSFYGVVQGGKVVMLPADDGQWLNKTTVAEAFRALEQRAEAAEANLCEETHRANQKAEYLETLTERMLEAETKLAEKGAPVAMRFRYHPSPCCAGSWIYADIDKFKADTSGRYQEQELFTRPADPVPVKLPDRYDIASMIDVEKDDNGQLYLREDVIDAIRSAGYEAQE